MEDGIASATEEHFDDFGIYHASKLLEDDMGNYLDDDFDCDISFGFPQRRQRRRRRTTSKILDDFLEFTKERDLSTKSLNDGIDLKIPFTDEDVEDDDPIMDIYKSADSFLNPSEYYHDVDQLSREEYGHQEVPQNDDASIPNQNQCCPKCGGMNQRFIDHTLKCSNTECEGTNHKIETEYDDFESIFNNNNNGLVEMDCKKPKKSKKKNKVVFAENGDSVENGGSGIKKSRRRQSNKAEITPPVQSNGLRLCPLCDREVRPQLCSGNKHRWRCVNKECRRWYGWVQIGEEIPKNLGKKGKFKNLILKLHENTENGKLVQMVPSSDNTTVTKQNAEEQINVEKEVKQQQKKIPRKRPLSPLTDEQINYVPSQLELRSRWWRPDRKRTEPSPDRQFIPSNLNVSAVSRIAEQSFRATAILTKSMISSSNQQNADDGTMCGFADLMLDSALGIIGPLLSLTSNIPLMNNNPDLQKKLFNNFEHLPVINP